MGIPESLAPTLVTVGLLCALLPWASRDNAFVRPALIALALLLNWRYILWRIVDTVPEFGTAEWLLGTTFLTFEVLTALGATMTWIILARIRSRSELATANTPWMSKHKPLVDVLICTYNEEESILERTIIGAMGIEYPNYRVWVLDDGKREWLRELCQRKGCYYLRRNNNAHAKAGNINNALDHLEKMQLQPEFVAILDADFVPFRDFLSRTIPLFRDREVGIVQTPQHFFNPDPIQSNLSITDVFPDEQRFFFDIIMPSKDAWGLAFCCGTSSVIRFSSLCESSGFPTDSVTEDFLLTIRLQELGYKTIYLNEKLSVGLAPEGLREYATQRARWCLGFVQIIRGSSSPFRFRSRVPWSVRFGLIETFLYWGASFPFRILCLLAPVSYFLFGWRWVHASLSDAVSHFAPMCVSQIVVMAWLGGGRILPLLAEVYQLLIAPEIVATVAAGLLRPKSHEFKVTAKGIQHAGLNVQWRLLGRFVAIALATILGIAGVLGGDHSDLIEGGGAISLFWGWYNLAVLTLCCFVCLEQPRRRLDERFSTDQSAILAIGGWKQAFRVKDVSAGGLCLSGRVDASIGSAGTIKLGTITVPTVIARKSEQEFAVMIVGDNSREIMTRHVYSEAYGKPIRRIRPSQVLSRVLRRIFR